MAGSGTITLSGTIVGLPNGQRVVSQSYPIDAAIDESLQLTLAVGDNEIAVPGGASAVMIDLPVSNTVLVTLSPALGIAGVALHKTLPAWLPIDSSQTVLVLNAASALAGPVQVMFV